MKGIYIIMLLTFGMNAFGQTERLPMNDSIENRIVIIGDAGDPGSIKKGRAVVIDAVRNTVPMDKKTTVLFVGDNLYVNGLPCEEDVCYIDGVDALDSQAYLVKGTEAHAYFMPGNHDWANSKPEGLENILRQGAFIDRIDPDHIKFYPEDGCPGPVEIPLSKDAVLVIMDSQWWLERAQKPGLESDCPYKTETEVLAALKDILDHNPKKLVIVACHHPFKSTGVHSGYFSLKQHIFPFTDINKNLYIPLPLLGSIYPIARGVFGSPQDLHYPAYANMISSIEEVLKTHPYVMHLAGHEHNLQLLSDSGYYYLVSGGGCKSQRVAKSRKTKFISATKGFAVMDISKNRNVHVTFYTLDPNDETVKKAYSETIFNFSKFPVLTKDTATVPNLVFQDSVIASVNKDYARASWFKRVMEGNNYRKEWAAPVKFKVFDIKNEMGGFKVLSLGGTGKQTHSLHLEDKNGKRWTLRSLNKNSEKVIPRNFRHSFAEDIVQDMISASHPYGALTVPPLADALHIVHATPHYYFVPNDYGLGQYRPLFANTACMLEELDPGPDGKGSKSTSKMFNKILEKNNHKVDQKTFLKARMLDFLIADFDRHYDQWKWGSYDSAGKKIYYPIPKDRDQALFHSDGLLLWWASRKRMPFLKGFRYDIPNINGMGYVARDLDRTYLNELSAGEWQQTMQEFKAELNDSVIHEAVKQLPPEIAAMDSATIEGKFRSRRNLLPEKSMTYYKFLSKKVTVIGSNENEYFHISQNGPGIDLNVYARKEDGTISFPTYSRHFDYKVTKEVTMWGFNGDDLFKVDSNVRSKIKLVMIGGQGFDTFNIKGRTNNYIYDFRKGNNVILAHNHTKNMMSNHPEVNQYDSRYNYNVTYFPKVKLGYNPEDQMLVGVGLMSKTYDFRKVPFSTENHLGVLMSPSNQAYQINFNGQYIYLYRKTDLVVNGEFINPTLNNFFGFGNETKKAPGTDIHYYRVRYKDVAGDVMLRQRFFQDVVSISAGPAFFYYWNKYRDNVDRILAHPGMEGLDSASIYKRKTYAGGKLSLRINNVNDELFPTRGINWVTDFTSMAGLNENSKSITKLESDMAIYASLSSPANVVAVMHLGAGHIFSNQFEYFQALTLGANNYLRGFRKDRFSGSSLAYLSLELRAKLFDFRSYILPGELGLVGFNDMGRVWMRNESSGLLHDAYGGGIYFIPFHTVIISATTALSGEESLFNFTVGAKINLTF